MSFLLPFDTEHLPAFGKNWRRFFLWGIGMVILGYLAISAATFTTLLSVVFIGFLLFFSGAIVAVDTLTFWWGKWSGFFIHLLVAILYLSVGVMLMQNPIEGSVSLTLLLGVFFIVTGLIRILLSSLKTPRWKWALLNGIVTLILGVLIISHWPASSLFIIGLFVGIDLLFFGLAYLMSALAARNFVRQFK